MVVAVALLLLAFWPSWKGYAAFAVLLLTFSFAEFAFYPPVEPGVMSQIWVRHIQMIAPIAATYAGLGAAIVATRRYLRKRRAKLNV